MRTLLPAFKPFKNALVWCAIGMLWMPAAAAATDYHVGPGQALQTIGAVPWFSLAPGDTVFIHNKSTPYYEKFLISTRGTASQWIRVLGVPGAGGELPVISGKNATTSTNMHYRWTDASGSSAIQDLGVIQIATARDDANGQTVLPAYIEIANLQVQDGYKDNRFTAENGTGASFHAFAACIYARSVAHLIIRENVLTNCGQGFYTWTGSGTNWWDGTQIDTVVRSNYFYNNGSSGEYGEHQSYTESDGVTYEFNHFGAMRIGSMGSQLKDRSAGTVIRYNYIEASPSGWMIDLVEPENGYGAIGTKATYRQTFVYGNAMISRGATVNGPNMVHWNEDHQVGVGRAVQPGSKLLFYHNTVVIIADRADFYSFHIFNTTFGAYDCPPGSPPGVIDVRNNIIAVLPRTAGAAAPPMAFAYCGSTNLAFGANWVSPGWVVGTAGTVTGTSNLVSPPNNLPGFAAANDFHLANESSALGIGGNLAPETVSNSLGQPLIPTQQYVEPLKATPRATSGAGSAAGAFEGAGGGGTPTAPVTPANLRILPP